MPVVDEDAFSSLESSALPSLGDQDSLLRIWPSGRRPRPPSHSWPPFFLSERDAASQGHISGIPASGCFIPEADAGSTARAFMLPGRLCHLPVTSRLSFGQFTHVIQIAVTLGEFP